MTIGAVSNYGMGLGLGSTNYLQYANDPYFLQALQSPNYYQLQAQNMQQAGTQVPTATTTANPSFKGASEEIAGKSGEEKKSNKAAKWVLGILATAGTVFTAWKCHGKGVGENWYSKIWDGAKKYWNQGISKVKNLFKPETATPRPAQSVGPFIVEGQAYTPEYRNAVNEVYRGWADDITQRANEIEQHCSMVEHYKNSKKYQALFGA